MKPRSPRGRAGGAARRIVEEAVQEPVPRGEVDSAVRVDRRSSRSEHVLPDRVLPLHVPRRVERGERAEAVEALRVDEVDLAVRSRGRGRPDVAFEPEVVPPEQAAVVDLEGGERIVPIPDVDGDGAVVRVMGQERRRSGDIGVQLGAPFRRQLWRARVRGIDGAEAESQAHVDRAIGPDDRRHLDLVESLPHLHGPRRGRAGWEQRSEQRALPGVAEVLLEHRPWPDLGRGGPARGEEQSPRREHGDGDRRGRRESGACPRADDRAEVVGRVCGGGPRVHEQADAPARVRRSVTLICTVPIVSVRVVPATLAARWNGVFDRGDRNLDRLEDRLGPVDELRDAELARPAGDPVKAVVVPSHPGRAGARRGGVTRCCRSR